ncbi:MAG TPA: hypothetical protein VIU62_13015, partial [Chloroflexota bacterium]
SSGRRVGPQRSRRHRRCTPPHRLRWHADHGRDHRSAGRVDGRNAYRSEHYRRADTFVHRRTNGSANGHGVTDGSSGDCHLFAGTANSNP